MKQSKKQGGSNDIQDQPPRKFQYTPVLGREVGRGWLGGRPEAPMPVQEYRKHLFAAFKDARDRYVQRQTQQGGIVPQSIQKAPKQMNLLTMDPVAPDFALKRHALHKIVGMCMKSQLKRFFTVDQENLKYYEDEQNRNVKKTLPLKDAKAFMEEKSEFMSKQKGQAQPGDEWAEPNQNYRIGIQLAQRQKGPVYFYSTNLHDAKFLLVNISLYGNQYKASSMTDMIEIAYLIEKVSRFQKLIGLLCYAKEKRFVAMHGFQQLSIDMIEIAQQSHEYRRLLTLKWFTNMLGEDEKPVIRSPFRAANPQGWEDEDRQPLNEKKINKYISKMQNFIKNRRINRLPLISKEISKQAHEETTGLHIDSLNMIVQGDNILSIGNGQASIILDPEDSYKFAIIENKSLDHSAPAATSSIYNNMRKRQAENLIRKIKIEDISVISTDLDQVTQFDFNNKVNKQVSYKIRLYGRMNQLANAKDDNNVSPSQLGYDILRQSKAQYRISINHIKFPPQMAQQDEEKIVLYAKLYQQMDGGCAFEHTTQGIKIKGFKTGSFYPDQSQETAIFNVNSFGPQFGLGLEIRVNKKPMPLIMERFMENEVIRSQQMFAYSDLNSEQFTTMKDSKGNQYEITFSVSKIENSIQGLEMSEAYGKRLLVGRYVLYQGRPCYVRSVRANGMLEIIETISKIERKVNIQNISLIEKYGVNVFKLGFEPQMIQKSNYDWIIDLKVYDKRILNSIQQKIQFRQAHLAHQNQDKKTKDDLSTIQGDMIVSMIEVKGLIVPSEVNRRQQEFKNKVDPVVEIRLEKMSGAVLKTQESEVVKGKRDVFWGGKKSGSTLGELVVDLGRVNHSGMLPEKEVEVQRSKKSTVVKKPVNKLDAQNRLLSEAEDKQFIHIIVNNKIDGQQIGDAKIELDELIDVNLSDLAKEYCVCLNRSHILEQITQKAIASGKNKDSVMKQMSMFTQYSGIIRFQTLFKPTKDTSLRFEQTRDIGFFKSPKQLLHFEYLMEKSDFDQFKYKIPQIAYNPNNKSLGESYMDLPNLILQCEKNPQIQSLLKKLQSQDITEKTSMQQARATLAGNKISDEVIKEIDQTVEFQSPFEKLYIILKLQRKERPFLEQVFFNFRNIWEIYTQTVKNNAFDSLTLNEWLSFIEELASKHNFKQMEEVFDQADDAADNEDPDKSQMTQRSVSFVGDMVKQMNNKAVLLKRQSTMMARDVENGSETKNFSLVLCQEWEKEGNQSFIDLVNLVKSGIPALLRTVVWSDLMKTNIISIEEKKQMMKNYPQKYNKQLSVFENFLEISQKFDSIAFRQIDQDISDFKFPAHYYEDVMDQNSSQAGYKIEANSPAKIVNRINKLKHDKQQMRKLLRILLVWGKNFKHKGIQYQLSYPSGFLKVAHRFINLMSMEDAFWVLIGFIRSYPRLWCLQESSMLDEGKSNIRFELTAIKAILEVNFPIISQKLYQIGLPVEALVYDSISSLYCDYFHSDTLLRIWDLMIFYFNTSERRRGIWLLLAPALLILQWNQKAIDQAQTAQEVIQIYKDGCGIDYNPNHVIQMLNNLIDDIFVTEGKQVNPAAVSSVLSARVVESGGTGSGGKESTLNQQSNVGFISGIFGFGKKTADGNPTKVDEIRRSYQDKQNLIFDNTRHQNKVIADFLFKNSDEEKKSDKQPNKGISKSSAKQNRPRRDSSDSLEFGDGNQDDGQGQNVSKPSPHQTLDYRHWRMDIIPAIQNQFLMTEEIVDDDLHEFEDTQIYQKTNLDIKVIHIYLHNLENWYGTDDDRDDFKVQIQYGRLHPSGKFEVKHYSKDEDECVKTDSNLQYFCNFKYSKGFNHIKVKIVTTETESKVCHCYVDIRGQQRGKFIYFLKTMNAKEYTQNPESQFALTQLKMSMFLESKKEVNNDQIQQDEETDKLAYLYSLNKYEPNFVNIYRFNKEKQFQKALITQLQTSVHTDFTNFNKYLGQFVAIDILNNRYNFTDILPRPKFGHLSPQLFKHFIEKCLPEHANAVSLGELNRIYKDILSEKPTDLTPKQVSFKDLVSNCAILNTESLDSSPIVSEKVFSLRSFIFSVILQSPLTVKEKLDIIYDITDMSSKFIDGIDLHDAQMIYETLLRQHLYYVPYNELRTIVENVYNDGQISGVVAAYWTKRIASEIKYDINKKDVITLETFLAAANNKNVNVVDVTKEVQETFVMYQNMFGNKILDLNDDTSPFIQFNNVFASTGKADLGSLVLQKSKDLGNFRLCIVSQIAGGERIITEVQYGSDGIIIVDEEKQPNDKNQFKRFFMKNINVLDLSGKHQAISKHRFMAGTKKIPLVYDLMRAETFWQDRKMEATKASLASLKMKKRLGPVVNIFLSDKDKIFIFKFENKVMGGRTDQTTIKELVKNQIFMFEIEALFLEDIILDMRDRIVNEFHKVVDRGMQVSEDFISGIEGKMEFFVRKVVLNEAKNEQEITTQRQMVQTSVVGNVKDLKWEWKNVNDFDRLEKFSDDEVFEDEVVFKLVQSKGSEEEILDEKPQYMQEGYDCFSIYKHSDNSYEWRLCKIVGKETRPEFKQMAMDAFLEIGGFAQNDQDSVENQSEVAEKKDKQFGADYRTSVHESDQFYYFLEFQHLKESGREMWVKRRREDVIFSSRYARDQQNFEKSCFKFIMDTYK